MAEETEDRRKLSVYAPIVYSDFECGGCRFIRNVSTFHQTVQRLILDDSDRCENLRSHKNQRFSPAACYEPWPSCGGKAPGFVNLRYCTEVSFCLSPVPTGLEGC